jgi:hypothetical protein
MRTVSCLRRMTVSIFLSLTYVKPTKEPAFRYAASTYDFEYNMIRDGIDHPGKKVVTFSNILNYNVFPLAEILQTLLKTGQEEMNNPIEIEFAVDPWQPGKASLIFSIFFR